MNKQIRALKARKADAVRKMRELSTAAGDAGFTAEQDAEFKALDVSVEALNGHIAREEKLAATEAQIGVEVPAGATITVGENIEKDAKRGFKSFGDYAQAVQRAGTPGKGYDRRLDYVAAAPTTFGNESSGPDGGYLIPPEFSKEIFTLSLEGQAIYPMCDDTPVEGNSMVFPKDETTPWGTDGVRAYWQAEATAGTQVKPKVGTSIMRLHKLMALVPLTDELMSDTNALTAYLPKLTARSIRWKTDEACLWGSGNGTPLGMFYQGGNNYPSVVQAKDASQATNTISPTNLTNMIARLPDGTFDEAYWLVNQSVLPFLFTMTLGNYPVWAPVGGGDRAFGGSPYGVLFGRPILVSQHAKAFSSQSDVSLFVPSWYRTISKRGGMETATSMHLYFDADALAFRTTFRIDGQPKITTAINPANGSTTLSPFVTLAAR